MTFREIYIKVNARWSCFCTYRNISPLSIWCWISLYSSSKDSKIQPVCPGKFVFHKNVHLAYQHVDMRRVSSTVKRIPAMQTSFSSFTMTCFSQWHTSMSLLTPRQEKSHSPIILPNGEYHENPTLTVRFAILENVQWIRRFLSVNARKTSS